MWGDDLGRGSYWGETGGQGSTGRPHELAISSSKQYALMATCWPLLASLCQPTRTCPSFISASPCVSTVPCYQAVRHDLGEWMLATAKSCLYADKMDEPLLQSSSRAIENDFLLIALMDHCTNNASFAGRCIVRVLGFSSTKFENLWGRGSELWAFQVAVIM